MNRKLLEKPLAFVQRLRTQSSDSTLGTTEKTGYLEQLRTEESVSATRKSLGHSERKGGEKDQNPSIWYVDAESSSVPTVTSMASAPDVTGHMTTSTNEKQRPQPRTKPKGTREYEVKLNDTLASIAAQFDTTPSELIKLNKLVMRTVFPAMVLYVPDGSSQISDEEKSSSPSPLLSPQEKMKFDVPIVKMADKPPARIPGHVERQQTASHPPPLSHDAPPPHKLSEDEIETIDRECLERFIKINVKHITDGQGVVSGTLLVTPNAVMFDPNVSDPLVIEHGAEKYGMITPMDMVISAAMYHDIAAMKLRGQKSCDGSMTRPQIYHTDDCPLFLHPHRSDHRSDPHPPHPHPLPLTDNNEAATDMDSMRPSRSTTVESLLSEAESLCSCGALSRDLNLSPGEDLASHTFPGAGSSIGGSSDKGATFPGAGSSIGASEKGTMLGETGSSIGRSSDKVSMLGETEDNGAMIPGNTDKDSMPVGNNSMIGGTSNKGNTIPGTEDQSSMIAGNPGNGTNLARSSGNGTMIDGNSSLPRTDVDPSLPSSQSESQVESDVPSSIVDSIIKSSDGCGAALVESDLSAPIENERTDAERSEKVRGGGSGEGEFKVSGDEELKVTGEQEFKARGEEEVEKNDSKSTIGSISYFPIKETAEGKLVVKGEQSPVPVGSALPKNLRVDTDTKTEVSDTQFSPLKASAQHLNNFVNYATGLFRTSTEDQVVPDIHDMKGDGGATTGEEADARGTTLEHQLEVENAIKLEDKPDLFQTLDKLIARPSTVCDDPPLYLCLRVGQPKFKEVSQTCPIESYRGNKKKPEYWFSIPREKVDQLYAFFVQWTPDIYGDEEDMDPEQRGFVVFDEDDVEAEENLEIVDEHFASIQKIRKDWEIISKVEAIRRMSSVDTEDILPLPELIGTSTILTRDDYIQQLSNALPPRTIGYPWTLVYSSEIHGFSLKTLYRNMQGLDSPVLMVVTDTSDHIFGAVVNCPLKISDHFYGTGESFLYTFYPEYKVFHWSGENNFFIKGNQESLAIGAGQGLFGLWFDGDLYHGRSHRCDTFDNDILTEAEDFCVKAFEGWAFV